MASSAQLPVGHELSLTLPAIQRKNARIGGTRDGVELSTSERAFRELVTICAKMARLPHLNYGRWSLVLTTYWPRWRHLKDGTKVPYGDIDATVTATLDALEKAGVFDDDVRVSPAILDRAYDKENPRIELTLRREE